MSVIILVINKSETELNSAQSYYYYQEIIKVRERILRIGPLTTVIPLKLFLDIVPSSSEDATRATRGQLKRLSRDYLRRPFYVLILFHSRDVFGTLSRLFGLSFLLCSFGCSLFGCLFGFREFNKTNLNGNGCKRALYFFAHFFAFVYKRSQDNILCIRENANYCWFSPIM